MDFSLSVTARKTLGRFTTYHFVHNQTKPHCFFIHLNRSKTCHFFLFVSHASLTNEDKSSPSEAFPFPNTTPLSQLRNCVWKENVTPDATIKTYLSLNEDTDVQNKRIQSTIRKPLSELTYCEFHGSTSIGSTNAPILQNNNSNNTGIVQFDCPIGRSKTNVFNTEELLPKEIVGSSSSHASLNSSAFSEVLKFKEMLMLGSVHLSVPIVKLN
ncbi:hypothetical protein DEO72_LG10g2376 [Vigna unguiculata]|uniref:Uncharacterized protein n=1 Tax=Vigna unguiculata TaxID=3917 RepID=A0A4D6NBD4_VIGUN|nr:hypothetical protein DEO72_LG10g2376 [Vigna unguiculata]